MKTFYGADRREEGFTLVEIIVVLVILGIVAGILIVGIDPIEQIKRGRDGARKNAVGELSLALQSYGAKGNSYPIPTPGADGWITTLLNKNEVKSLPQQIEYSDRTSPNICATNKEKNYCYKTSADGVEAIIYTWLESEGEKSSANCAVAAKAYYLWSSQDERVGVVCSDSEPSAMGGYAYQ